MSKKTAILILAAGASQRLGTPKQLLPWKDTTLLGYTIEEALATTSDTVLAVLGAHYEEIYPTIDAEQVETIRHPDWATGMGGSIAASIPHLHTFDQVLITLCDLPLVGHKDYDKLLTQHALSPKGITATAFDDRIGVPAVFDRSYFKTLSKLQGDRGARALIKTSRSDVQVVKATVPFRDVDTMEDYSKLIRLTDT